MARFLIASGGGGIGNTLSSFAISYSYNKHVYKGNYIFYFPINFSNQCNFILDFFKPMDGVSYLKNAENFDVDKGISPLDDYSYELISNSSHSILKNRVERVEVNEDSLIDDFNNNHSFQEDSVYMSFSDFPHRLPVENTSEAINSLRLKPQILKIVNDLCETHSINKDTWGAHIRSTDSARFHKPKIEELHELCKRARNENRKIFLCSDDPCIEQQFKNLYPQQIICTNKTFYPQKLAVDKSWNDSVELISLSGEKLTAQYNSQYSPACVLEGIIDFFLLSRSNFILPSWGTYSQWAKFFSNHYNCKES